MQMPFPESLPCPLRGSLDHNPAPLYGMSAAKIGCLWCKIISIAIAPVIGLINVCHRVWLIPFSSRSVSFHKRLLQIRRWAEILWMSLQVSADKEVRRSVRHHCPFRMPYSHACMVKPRICNLYMTISPPQ